MTLSHFTPRAGCPLFPEGEQYEAIKKRDGLEKLCADSVMQAADGRAGAGVIPKVNYYKFAQYAHNLEEAGADLILLACSTFNYAAELGRPLVDTPIAQIDRPMMELAVKNGRKIGLLATLATTVPSSERLLDIAAAEVKASIERKTVLCPEAFETMWRMCFLPALSTGLGNR